MQDKVSIVKVGGFASSSTVCQCGDNCNILHFAEVLSLLHGTMLNAALLRMRHPQKSSGDQALLLQASRELFLDQSVRMCAGIFAKVFNKFSG
jgi:hypothetical protein